ncbi:MAG: LamG domain-containing protein, partial [Bacteroidetes bacterium]|nr:LamG domain-containing protein [Bacteroidota bacterium]
DIPDDINGVTNWAVTAWVKTASTFSGDPSIRLAVGSVWTNNDRTYFGHSSSGDLHAQVGNTSDFGSFQLTVSTWYHMALVFSGGSNAQVFVNGVSKGTATGVTYGGSSSLNIGSYDQGQNSHWNGYIDEVHISNTARSADWILTDYNNQNSPNTFYSLEVQHSKTWDGGASTSNWGDANNWNPDGVPESSDDVLLDGANTINVNVAGVCNDLILDNSSLVLNISSGKSLTVSGTTTRTDGSLVVKSTAV